MALNPPYWAGNGFTIARATQLQNRNQPSAVNRYASPPFRSASSRKKRSHVIAENQTVPTAQTVRTTNRSGLLTGLAEGASATVGAESPPPNESSAGVRPALKACGLAEAIDKYGPADSTAVRGVVQAGIFVLILAALAPPAPATHREQTDWTLSNPNDPNFKGIFDQQLLLYAEASAPSAKPFLSENDDKAGSASYGTLDAPASGATTLAASAQGGRPGASFDVKLANGLSMDVFLNLSRPINGRLFFSNSLLQAGASGGKGVEATTLRVEIYSGERRIGGYEDSVAPTTTHKPWPWISLNIWPEVAVLRKGDALSVRISRSGGAADFLLGTDGDHQSFLDVRYTNVDPLSGALYMEDRKIVSYDGGGSEAAELLAHAASAPGFVSLPPGIYRLEPSQAADSTALSAFPLVALPGLIFRRRAAPVLLALLVCASVLSGCLGNPDARAGATGPDAERESPSVSVAYEPAPNQTIAGVGAVNGTIRSQEGLPLDGAHVALLGTNLFTQSDKKGQFGFSQVPRGEYRMRVNLKAFAAYEETIEVRAANITRLVITLVRAAEKPAADRPHLHDPWSGATSIAMFSGNVNYAGCRVNDGGSGTNCPSTEIPLDYHKPFLPGTNLVDVKLTWTDGPGVAKEFGLIVRTGVTHYQWKQAGGGGTGVFTQTYVARGSGDEFHVPVFPNEADPGHQGFTSWQMWIAPPNHGRRRPLSCPEPLGRPGACRGGRA